jgi:uncharacterized protein
VLTGNDVVRARVRDDDVIVEVAAEAQGSVTADALEATLTAMREEAPRLRSISLDDAPYAPGRAFVALSAVGGVG